MCIADDGPVEGWRILLLIGAVNNPEWLSDFPVAYKNMGPRETVPDAAVATLGILWNSVSDDFRFKIVKIKINEGATATAMQWLASMKKQKQEKTSCMDTVARQKRKVKGISIKEITIGNFINQNSSFLYIPSIARIGQPSRSTQSSN